MKNISYRRAVASDYDVWHALKSERTAINWSGFTQSPDYSNVKPYFEKQVLSETRYIYMVLLGDEIVGTFQIDKRNDKLFEYSSMNIFEKWSGMGIGSYIYIYREREVVNHGGAIIYTWISEQNRRSWRCAEKNGFLKTEEMEIRNLPLLGGNHIFYKWVKQL